MKAFFSMLLFGAAAVAGCSAEPLSEDFDGDEDYAESEDALSSRVSLKYEGTCEFLRSCSSFSKGLPKGQVTWGCTGRGACDDDGLWVAGPTRAMCGKSVKFCNGSKCTTAVVKDVSVSRNWEASNGVLDALDLSHGLSGRCSGHGGGSVTVQVGAKKAPSSSGGSTQPTNDGCWSPTLGESVDEKVCVQAKSNSRWYQCVDGEWRRGTSASGPLGACKDPHPLE